ncbi:MAG TPA: sugar phosphate isomerase/epimerase family protein [Candidatus Sulfotelmatobacter sp.]|nr:sugar phosphate isomerase/epimerase family protein [Candidatus Sulfotelmatobacter sp.]
MMLKRIDRRHFLLGAGTAVIAGPEFARAARSWSPTAKTEPGSTLAPRLLTGCCAYSYSKLLGAGRMTMEDVIRKAVELGIDGVDMTAYWFKSTDPAYLASLRHLAFKQGVCFSGAAIGASTVQADAGKRAQVLEEIKKWVDLTESLGAPHLRVFAGKLPAGANVQQGIEWTVDTLKSACEHAGKKGITLGMEDHEGITQNADTCLEIVRRVDSPFFGINLDITNFVPTAKADAYAQIEASVPYATHAHVRDRFANGEAVDLDRVWRIFAQSNYKGFISAEYEGEEDPSTGVPKLVDKIKVLCRKYSSV